MGKKYYLSEEDRKKLKGVLGGRKTPPRKGYKRIAPAKELALLVQITGNFQVTENKWSYGGTVVYPVINGNGEIEYRQPIPAIQISEMYNTCEAFNSADPSVRGNGVNSGGADYPEGFAMQPIRGNPVVRAWPVRIEDEGVDEFRLVYLFTQPNAEDGTCQ